MEKGQKQEARLRKQVQWQVHLAAAPNYRSFHSCLLLLVVDNDDAGMKIYYLGNYIMKNA